MSVFQVRFLDKDLAKFALGKFAATKMNISLGVPTSMVAERRWASSNRSPKVNFACPDSKPARRYEDRQESDTCWSDTPGCQLGNPFDLSRLAVRVVAPIEATCCIGITCERK